MQSKARLLGHPVHQILIVFPLGLLITSSAFDAMRVVTGTASWSVMAFHLLTGGVGMGGVAAVFGLIDYLAIPFDTRARRVGRAHGFVSTGMLALFGTSWALRMNDPERASLVAVAVSAAGVALAALAGWLGGELVNRMAVGVAEDAGLDAPGSFAVWRGRRAHRVAASGAVTSPPIATLEAPQQKVG